MNEEIKEIIEHIKTYPEKMYCLSEKEKIRILDYITNLQQENKILKENAEHNDKVVDKARWNEMIYKSRCEKAIEYINTNINNRKGLTVEEYHNKWYQMFDYYESGAILKELLSILNGSDDK